MPFFMRLIGHYTDSGRPMLQPGSLEAETALQNQLDDEKDQRLVFNMQFKDKSFNKMVNLLSSNKKTKRSFQVYANRSICI